MNADASGHVVWRVFASPQRFGAYFVGSALSNIGTWCQNLAGILLIYALTGSTLIVGLITVAQFAWPIVLAPLAGAVADRADRRGVLVAIQIAGAVIAGLLSAVTIAGSVTVELALVAVALLGILMAFQVPAQLALIPSLVAPGQAELGLTLGSAQYNLARAIGPIVASAVIATWGVGAAFVLNAASYVVYALALWLVRPAPVDRSAGSARRGVVAHVLFGSRIVLPLFALAFLASAAAEVVTTLGPAMSVVVAGDEGWTGLFISGFGAGAVVGALAVAPALRRVRRRLPWALGVEAVGGVVFAVSILAGSALAALAGTVLIGLGFIVGVNRTLAIVQSMVPPDVIGRVTAWWLVAFLGGRVA
ncbi:MAG: MFS transporter, partial [Microbacterium sp.]